MVDRISSLNPACGAGRFTYVAALLSLAAWASPAEAVVISEIHYNPPGDDRAFEFIELANESTTPEDLSGWFFSEGIDFRFPEGTILGKRERIVVCANAQAVRDRYGIAGVFGDFTGRIDNDGERITLANQVGIPVVSVRFRDRGKWPTAADGTGHSLVLKSLSLDPAEPESWTWSVELGGSPGRAEAFEEEPGPRFVEVVLLDLDQDWRFARGKAPFSSPLDAWTQPGFDDSGWEIGPAGFGYGDNDDATVLADMKDAYTSVACRGRFSVAQADLAGAEFFLAIRYDDGFCAYANGVLFAEANCPEELTHDATATGSHEATEEERFPLPRELLVAGENVLAVAGYNLSATSLDFSLAPRVLARRRVETDAREAREKVVFNELARSLQGGTGWVELYNRSPYAVDLSGHTVTSDPAAPSPYVLPQGTILPPGGFLVLEEATSGLDLSTPAVRLFLRDPEGLVLAASIFDRPAPPDLAGDSYAEARFPDGGPLEWVTATPTPGKPNEVPAVRDIAINEIFYHPPENRRGEFIELYNRGSKPVDISGFRFDDGIDYTFPEGVVVPPGGYVVVAEDPALTAADHGLETVYGPYRGSLADGGENVRLADRWGNPVDEVRYHDGGAWSLWADGRGSSLELIDPFQDNAAGAAWAASDESNKSTWERLSYTVPDYRPAAESELHLLLVERGACLIDDVSIRRGDGPNLVPNPGFETSTVPWRIEGTHQNSRRVTYDAHSGEACLELVASGKGDTSVNRIETDTSPPLTRGPYEVSLWARWLRGTSLIVAHGEFSPGPWGGRPPPSVNLSGNTLGGRLRMTVPRNLGTPGAENSARRAVIEATGSGNLGPLIYDVAQEPVSPEPGAPVRVSARVSDSDGVAEVQLFYREGDANGAFAAVPLLAGPAALGEAGKARRFSGEIPGFDARRKVVFYIEASDTRGAVRRFPLEAPERTCVYQVQGPLSESVDAARVVLDDARTRELATRRLHSNHLLDGSFVFNDERIYYNVGVRYRGSPWGRPERTSYRVRFPKDRPFRRDMNAVNLTSRANGPVEAASYYLIGRAGTVAKPVAVPLYHFVAIYFNGSRIGLQRLYQPVDRNFIERWFPGSDGPMLKAVARLAFDDAGRHVGYDGASFDYMSENPENYRFYYFHVVDRNRDDWDAFMEWMRIMDPRVTSDAVHDLQIGNVLDVEGFLRVMVPRVFVSDWDCIGMGQGHNAYFTLDTRDGRWETIPFDLNQAMPLNQLDFPFFPTFDPGWARLIRRPATRRIYTRIAAEFLDGYWSTTRAGPFLDALQRDAGVSMGQVRSFVAERARRIRPQLTSFLNVPFRILTNGGEPISTDTTSIDLEGEAPVTVASILVQVNGGGMVSLEPVWTEPTRWRARLDLPSARNRFEFFGFSTPGELLGTAAIEVTTSARPELPEIEEIVPDHGLATGGYPVVIRGSGFTPGVEVFFGGSQAFEVSVESETTIRLKAPPAPEPLPPGGVVDVELVFPGNVRVRRAGGFRYETEVGFVRGDANDDGVVSVSDAVAVLLYLFAGRELDCEDAADADDDGAVNLTDAIGILEFLFRGGPQPPPPFPGRGPDPTPDALQCGAGA